MLHRIYLSPGMFGFGRLASYDYFTHVERGLSQRLRAAGHDVETHVVHVAPTASIRRRALKLTELVASTCGSDDGPIHLVGHSTGGLDARMVASPSVALAVAPASLAWRTRLATVSTINAPHFGTPLASFFTTASGQRALRAISALTFVALSLGSPPLAIVSAFVLAFGKFDKTLGLQVFDRATESLHKVLDDARSQEVRDYLEAMRQDQGAMVQLMPEAMDLYIAGVEDRPGVFYQCTVSMSPTPGVKTIAASIFNPWRTASATLFAVLHGISGRFDAQYPCSSGQSDPRSSEILEKAFGGELGTRANDGAVPLTSQIWGKLVWAGHGDHLDVIGHFHDEAATSPAALRDIADGASPHVDWLFSGSHFGRSEFSALMDALATGLLTPG